MPRFDEVGNGWRIGSPAKRFATELNITTPDCWKYKPVFLAVRASCASRLRQEPANVVEVGLHVFPHIAGGRRRFQLGPAAEPGFDDGANDPRKINLPLTE